MFTKSACQIVFKGVADGAEAVPKELPPAPAAANTKAMARGFLANVVLATRRQLSKDTPYDGWLNGTNWFQLRRREADVVELECSREGRPSRRIVRIELTFVKLPRHLPMNAKQVR